MKIEIEVDDPAVVVQEIFKLANEAMAGKNVPAAQFPVASWISAVGCPHLAAVVEQLQDHVPG